MATDLHNTLKSLCSNTEWKYAVFWKLQHRARMVLTWEDAYYDNCEQHVISENMCLGEALENMHGGRFSQDPLELAVAKMSYHVYSLGEGIVGRVVFTGKHQWIFADKHVANSFSSFESSDGWQSQFSAGIKTIVVVAVVPYGVVQLGSLNKVSEDMKLVAHIREVLLAVQDSSAGHVTSLLQYNLKNSLCLPHLPARVLASEIIPDGLSNMDKAAKKEGLNDWLPLFPYLQKQSDGSCYISSLPKIHQKTAVEMSNRHEDFKLSTSTNNENVKLLQLRSNISCLGYQNELGTDLVTDRMSVGQTSVWKDLGGGSEHNINLHSNKFIKDNINVCDVLVPSEKFGADLASFSTNLLDSDVSDRVKPDGMDIYLNEGLKIPESSGMKSKKELGKKLENQAESAHSNTSNTFLKFSAGCELLEALGPAFLKSCMSFDCEAEKIEGGNIVEMPEVMCSSQMTFDSGSENLLEAVVGSVCYSGSDLKSEKSVCKSVHSMLTAEKMPEPSSQTKHIVNSAGYSINQGSVVEEDTQNCSNSTGVYGAMSSKGFSSTCPTTCSEQFDKRSEPTKNSKKRARPGENCRPRPRDRQLIQDRIKELRELVPNGSKCSIDSLLERTIKHMLFLESITKHADKLNRCAESKLHQKGTDTSNYEQGSSWAVEVGGHLKVSSIIVENLNKSGQMLVEMLCEECSHFLEIADAIRSLGLTILKGITEVHGEKTWICFVVEGQDNRIMHRMDVLWSLVQILQPKTTS